MANEARKLQLDNEETNAKVIYLQKNAQLKLQRRRLKRQENTGAQDDSNWLISYADLMTLLVGFFVMLMAFSKINPVEFEKVKRETTKVFGGEYKIPFEKVSTELKQVVKELGFTEQVLFQEDEQGVTVTFRGALFFAVGGAELLPDAKLLLSKLIPKIKETAKDFKIVIEGHTDNSPISTLRFPSNWELSSIRACTVLRLFEEAQFSPSLLQAQGWGDTKPIVPNRDDQGQPLLENMAQNRRVVIRIIKAL